MSNHKTRPPHHGHDEPADPEPGAPPIDPDDGVAPMPAPLDPEDGADAAPI